jgi:hypothetical protein
MMAEGNVPEPSRPNSRFDSGDGGHNARKAALVRSRKMTQNDWTLGHDRDAPPGYRWLVEHPDRGEFYFRTRREAERFMRSQRQS